jgi:hypothetical protein
MNDLTKEEILVEIKLRLFRVQCALIIDLYWTIDGMTKPRKNPYKTVNSKVKKDKKYPNPWWLWY